MDYALCLTTGREYEAWNVTYAQARSLRLICPVCKGLVFKSIRRVPAERHFFSHHHGGAPDCELYHPSPVADLRSEASSTDAKGQEFALFLKSVLADLKLLVLASGIVAFPMDSKVFAALLNTVQEYEFDVGRASLGTVPDRSAIYLSECANAQDLDTTRRLSILCEFFQNPQARFVDMALAAWMGYCIQQRSPRLRYDSIVKAVLADSNLFDDYCALMMCGLTLLNADQSVDALASKFRNLEQSIAMGLRKREENAVPGKKPRGTLSIKSSLAGTETAESSKLSTDAATPLAKSKLGWELSPDLILSNRFSRRRLTPDEWYLCRDGAYYVVLRIDGLRIPLDEIDGRPTNAECQRMSRKAARTAGAVHGAASIGHSEHQGALRASSAVAWCFCQRTRVLSWRGDPFGEGYFEPGPYSRREGVDPGFVIDELFVPDRDVTFE